MIKLQTYYSDGLGWSNQTRAGELPEAWRILFAYRRDYPSLKHRLVSVSEIDNSVTVLQDDAEALAQVKSDWEIDNGLESKK